MISITRLCILSLMSMFALTASAEEAATRGSTEKCILQKVCAIDAKLQCGNAIPFGSAEINQPGGYVIRQPGTYCLKEDVVFNPNFSPIVPVTPVAPYDPLAPTTVQAAITILSSDVFIELGSHRLSQARAGSSDQVPYCVGIVVPDMIPNNPDVNAVGLRTIHIEGDSLNGANIEGFSMVGIRIFAHVRDVVLRNIVIENTARLASLAVRPPASETYGFPYLPHAASVAFGPSWQSAGLALGESNVAGTGPVWFADIRPMTPANRISEVILENVTIVDNFRFGVIGHNISNMSAEDVHIEYTWSDDPGTDTAPAYTGLNPIAWQGGGNAAGIAVDFVHENCLFLNCTFNSSLFPIPGTPGEFITPSAGSAALVSGTTVGGANFNYARACRWINCEFSGHSCTFTNSNRVNGIVLSAPEDSLFENCHFDHNTCLAGAIQGMHVSGFTSGTFKSANGTIFRNCTANGNRIIAKQIPGPVLAPTTVSLYGFLLAYAKNITMENCTAQNNVVYVPTTGLNDQCAGFVIAPSATAATNPPVQDATMANIVLRNCIASGNITLLGGSATGFYTENSNTDAVDSLVYENCIGSGNESRSPGLPPEWRLGAPFPTSYNLGQTVSYANQNYISLINGNVDTPNAGAGLTSWAVTLPNVLPWSNVTAYVTNNTVTFSPAAGTPALLYAAIANSTGAQPNTSPASWVQLVVNPATWSSATTYSIGQQVYWNGYNYFSRVNNNLNRQPDLDEAAWGLYPGRSALSKPLFIIQDWNGSLTYTPGSYVAAAGIIYVSRTTNTNIRPDTDLTLTNWTPYASGTGTVFQSIAQGGGFGFSFIDSLTTSPEKLSSFPASFTLCQALHNKGLPVFNSTNAALNPRYSAGFALQRDGRTLVSSCIAEDNIYGFFLKNCNREVLRENQSDNNVDLQFMLTNPGGLPYVGEGFTDVGPAGTPAAPGISTSVFQTNTAFANGMNTNYFGTNQNYNVIINGLGTYVPLLEIQNSSPATSYLYVNPATPTQAHNISTIS